VFDFARSYSERQRAEGAVRGRVGIPAHGDAARQGESLLGPDDVDDSLPFVRHSEVREAEVGDVPFELQHLRPARRLLDEGLDVDEVRPVRRGDVVIDGDEGAIRPPGTPFRESQPLEGLRRRHFVDEVPVHVQQGRHAVVIHDVIVPDLVVQGPGGGMQAGRSDTRNRRRRPQRGGGGQGVDVMHKKEESRARRRPKMKDDRVGKKSHGSSCVVIVMCADAAAAASAAAMMT
jgi:hypothetical protein